MPNMFFTYLRNRRETVLNKERILGVLGAIPQKRSVFNRKFFICLKKLYKFIKRKK